MTASYASVGLVVLGLVAGCASNQGAGVRGVTVPQPAARQFKPRLYVLAVGVSAYQRTEYKLDFGARDAVAFADFWKRKGGGLYESVETKVLVDGQATRAEVLTALEWVQGQVTQHDVAFIFLAGHGINDRNGRYYFGPHDLDPDRLRASAIPWTEMKAVLDASKGKRILFVDTCYAGNVTGQLTMRGSSDALARALDELAQAEGGTVTFGASTARQQAGESRALGGGLFTQALIEGLTGGADFTRDGAITVKELDLFVSRRVRELSEGRQSPVTPKIDEDYPIVVLSAPAPLALTSAERARLEVAKKHLALAVKYGRLDREADRDRELSEAYEAFNTLEEKLDEDGRVSLGLILLDGAVPRDARRGVALVTPLAQAGHSLAEDLLGLAHEKGLGLNKDLRIAVAWYKRSAEHGHPAGQFHLAEAHMLGLGGLTKDPTQAARWYRAATEQGHVVAPFRLGWMYRKGTGLAKDDAEAARWFLKSAEQGYHVAQVSLGYMHHYGVGMAPNYSEALRWYRNAAEQNDHMAESNIGIMYYEGQGVVKDQAKAVEWFRKAAEGGDRCGQYCLGKMLAEGHGAARDDMEAVKWFRKAAEQGLPEAQNAIGEFTEAGRVIMRDEAEALRWYERAGAQNDISAKKNLARLRAAIKSREGSSTPATTSNPFQLRLTPPMTSPPSPPPR